jgi:hypothetical protein
MPEAAIEEYPARLAQAGPDGGKECREDRNAERGLAW